MKQLWIMLIFLGLLVSCGPAAETAPMVETVSSHPTTDVPPTAAPTQAPLPPAPTVTSQRPTETTTTSPTAEPPTVTSPPACITLIYGENAQFEIFSDPAGPRVFVDVYDPTKLTGPVSASDILLTTHTHWDHVNEAFQASFPGEQIFVQAGSLSRDGIHIQGLASSHNAGENLQPEGGTNYIYIIDLTGLRLVHFGDIGQASLTDEQLSALGAVDIAITQLNNSYSEMNAANQKGLRLMEQLQPRLIIPTHVNLDTAKLAVAHWPGWYSETPSLEICQSALSAETQILFLGQSAQTIPRYLDLSHWGE